MQRARVLIDPARIPIGASKVVTRVVHHICAGFARREFVAQGARVIATSEDLAADAHESVEPASDTNEQALHAPRELPTCIFAAPRLVHLDDEVHVIAEHRVVDDADPLQRLGGVESFEDHLEAAPRAQAPHVRAYPNRDESGTPPAEPRAPHVTRRAEHAAQTRHASSRSPCSLPRAAPCCPRHRGGCLARHTDSTLRAVTRRGIPLLRVSRRVSLGRIASRRVSLGRTSASLDRAPKASRGADHVLSMSHLRKNSSTNQSRNDEGESAPSEGGAVARGGGEVARAGGGRARGGRSRTREVADEGGRGRGRSRELGGRASWEVARGS